MAKQKLFFSYSRQDGSAFALRLAVDFKKQGYDVWIDQEDIRAGMEWDTEIEKALESCDCLLFLETPKSVVSVTCLDEVHYALEHDKKVIPLIFVDSKTPFRLDRLQHIDFTKNYDTGLALLLNELEGATQPIAFTPEEKIASTTTKLPFSKKNYWPLVIVTCLAILVTTIVLLTSTNKNASSAEATVPVTITDTNTNEVKNTFNTPVINTQEEDNRLPGNENLAKENTRKQEDKKAAVDAVHTKRQANESTRTTENKLNNLNEMVAGDWRLTGIEPATQSKQGYLKIEALGDKATIKTYMQFYYPESKASSYLTIFNAFAGCTSCIVNKEMKLKVEDVAVGSRTIKKLEEDQPDGRKAGEILLDANSNKSISATATLKFIDNNNAVITVQQPRTIALAHELILEPFVYTFRFKKSD